MRILIVDDNVIDIALLKRELDTSLLCDFTIKTSISVADGLKKLETESFDVILLDYEMPEIDGIEMIIEIRSKPNLGNTAIIIVSASLDSSVALNCIEAGAQDFIPKSSITQVKLYQAIIHSRKRFEMEQKMYESYLSVKTMAEKDPLTGLHNRYFFDENLQMMIAASQRSNTAIGMLALDLDNFKHINDSMGHEAGDLLLKEVVARIKRCLRVNDGFARLGGDEFAITLSNINAISEINMVTDRITNAFKEQFELSGKKVTCTMSIGAALYPNDAPSGSELVKCADIAMYRAKQGGKNGVCFYESHYQAEFNRRFTIQNDIIDTLADSTFRLFYQPIFCDQGKNILGFESFDPLA
ncbi:diguanylate cyclase domain-containing protein [Pseudocolwellia sp. HL-MZ19]|uniref:response regulator n=1 Tax=Pseudocolwellia sp. HL-MZ19 TaxID=3400846 RepID=UPI003CF8A2C2